MTSDRPIAIPPEAFSAADALRRRLDAVAPSKYEVGVGLKQKAGEFQDRVAVFVYVPEKRPADEVPEPERVPAEVEGFVTDVVEHRPVLASDVARYDPMRGGIQISRSGGTGVIGIVHFGTLGCIVRRRADAKLLLLTCAHVVAALDEDVFQPAHGETGAQIIGKSVDLRNIGAPLLHDFAVVEPNGLRGLGKTVEGVGPIKGVFPNIGDTLNVSVTKRGARTLLTRARVTRFVAGGVPAISVFELTSDPPGQLFAGKGDSGSVVLNGNGEVIGLLFAIPNEDMGTGLSSGGMAIPIFTVQEELKVDVAVDPVVSSVTPNSLMALGFPPTPVTIDGWGFDGTSQVLFDQFPALVLSASSRQLQVVPPPHFPGMVDVRVQSAAGDLSATGPAATFTY